MNAARFAIIVVHPDGREFVHGHTTKPDRAATIAVLALTEAGWSTVRRFPSFGAACDFCAERRMLPAKTAIVRCRVVPAAK